MDLKQLEYFVRVAELGGFSKAAEVLDITQPALSRQIRRLEVQMRRNLLMRNGRGVNLTDEGRILLAHARGILQQVTRAQEDVQGHQDLPVGKVVLGTAPAVGLALLAQTELVRTFTERYPRGSLEFIEGRTGAVHDWLMLGRADIGILYDPPPSPGLEFTLLGRENIFLVSPATGRAPPKGKTLPFKMLVDFPLILPSYAHGMRARAETAAAKAGIKLNISVEADGIPFIIELVSKGLGFTLLTRSTVDGSPLAHRLQMNPIISPQMSRALMVGMSLQRKPTYLAREVLKLVLHFLQLGAMPTLERPKTIKGVERNIAANKNKTGN